MSDTANIRTGTRTLSVLQHCLRPGGASNAECRDDLGLTVKQCSQAFVRLRRRGLIYRGKGGPKVCRYFGTQAEADAWALTHAAEARAEQAQRAAAKRWTGPKARQPIPGVRIDRRRLVPQGAATMADGVKVTVLPAPTHDARYQLDPAQPLPKQHRTFSATRPGINPLTRKRWETAA